MCSCVFYSVCVRVLFCLPLCLSTVFSTSQCQEQGHQRLFVRRSDGPRLIQFATSAVCMCVYVWGLIRGAAYEEEGKEGQSDTAKFELVQNLLRKARVQRLRALACTYDGVNKVAPEHMLVPMMV